MNVWPGGRVGEGEGEQVRGKVREHKGREEGRATEKQGREEEPAETR